MWLKCMGRLEWFKFCISYRSKYNWWVHNNAQLGIYSYKTNKRCRFFYSILLTYFSVTINLVQTTLIIHTFWTKFKFRIWDITAKDVIIQILIWFACECTGFVQARTSNKVIEEEMVKQVTHWKDQIWKEETRLKR